jgi:hypothetical protein
MLGRFFPGNWRPPLDEICFAARSVDVRRSRYGMHVYAASGERFERRQVRPQRSGDGDWFAEAQEHLNHAFDARVLENAPDSCGIGSKHLLEVARNESSPADRSRQRRFQRAPRNRRAVDSRSRRATGIRRPWIRCRRGPPRVTGPAPCARLGALVGRHFAVRLTPQKAEAQTLEARTASLTAGFPLLLESRVVVEPFAETAPNLRPIGALFRSDPSLRHRRCPIPRGSCPA